VCCPILNNSDLWPDSDTEQVGSIAVGTAMPLLTATIVSEANLIPVVSERSLVVLAPGSLDGLAEPRLLDRVSGIDLSV
jgi:hypothetical protein